MRGLDKLMDTSLMFMSNRRILPEATYAKQTAVAVVDNVNTFFTVKTGCLNTEFIIVFWVTTRKFCII